MKKKPVQESRRPSTGAVSRIYSRENVSRYSERARQRRRRRAVRRGILLSVVGVLACAVTAAGVWVGSIAGKLNNNSVITSGLLETLTDSNVTKDPFYMLCWEPMAGPARPPIARTLSSWLESTRSRSR